MRHDEDTLQTNCMKWLELQYPAIYPWMHHSPNGGRRNAREGARFKAMGVKAGFPDLFCPISSGGHKGLFIEMKTATGRLTPLQKAWRLAVLSFGFIHHVCRSFTQFQDIINEYYRGIDPRTLKDIKQNEEIIYYLLRQFRGT